MSRNERIAALLALGYFFVYMPFAYLIRGAGTAHGELAVLPVYSASCALTMVAAMFLARRHLPSWTLSWRAWVAGGGSAIVMYAASAAYMNHAPPVMTAVVMKIGTLAMAMLLDYLRDLSKPKEERQKPLLFPMGLAGAAVLMGWAAKGWGSFFVTIGIAVACVAYVIGWSGKMWGSEKNKGELSFGVAEQVATAVASCVVGALLVLFETQRKGFPVAAWLDWRAWSAGFFSQLTGMLATALVLFPARHAVCMAASKGASLAAGVVAQAARDGRMGAWELASAALAAWASTEAVKRSDH